MSNVVSLEDYRLEKEVRRELETVYPHNAVGVEVDVGGPVEFPSLDDYDNEKEEWWVGETWLFEDYDAGLLD